MSLGYNLDIATDLTPSEVTDIMADALAPHKHNDAALKLPGLGIISNRPGNYSQTVVAEDYGFRPTLNVIFEIDANEDYIGGMRAMMCGVMALLRHESGDAVMLFNGERTVLQRIGGKLLLNEKWDNWTAHARLLPEVTLPYELCFVPSPALDEVSERTPSAA